MFEQDLKKFAALIVGIGEIYDKPFTSAVVEIYWDILKEYEFEEIRAAIKHHLENPEAGKYVPKPSDIIMAIDGNPQNQASRAWIKVGIAVRSAGRYASVAFDDPLIHNVIKDMGGWIRFCNSDYKQISFIAKEFFERYRAYVLKKPASHPKYLIGFIESQNKSSGYKYDPPILIGDELKAKHVMTTGNHALTYDNRLLFSTSYSGNTAIVNTKN